VFPRQDLPATGDAAGIGNLGEDIRCRRGHGGVDVVTVHQLQRGPRDLRQPRRIAGEAPEHAGAALGRLKEKDAAPPVARRHWLGQDFTLFELEDDFETARERVLKSGHCSFGQRWSGNLEQQGTETQWDAMVTVGLRAGFVLGQAAGSMVSAARCSQCEAASRHS
jgi:hypothetical protein